MRPGAGAIGAVAIAAAAGAAALWSRSDLHGARGGGTFAAVGVAIALSLVGCGLAARRSRPASRTGALMIAAGFAWAATSVKHATDWPGAAIGSTLWAAVVLHLVLAFPSGRLPDRVARLVVATGYLAVTVLQVLPFKTVQFVVVAAVVVAAVVLLTRRHAGASTAERRSLAPVLWGGGLTLVVAALRLSAPPALESLASWATLAALGSLPFALLAGLFRSRLSALDGVARLMRQTHALPGPVQLRDALAQALGDPGLALAYWVPDRGHFVDARGRPVALPDGDDPVARGVHAGRQGDIAGRGEAQGREGVDIPAALGGQGDGGDRAVTRIGDPRPIAAILHDASLDPDAVRSAGAAAGLWLDRERLEADLRARVGELRDSRARLVAAADAERRRIERDLHDGAQQRLASLLLHLELERRALGPGGAADVLDGVATGLAESLAELRALAAGILPPVLRQDGLVAAIEELAARTALPVTVDAMPHQRLPDGIEVAAYFFVAEGLANVVKHAGAQSAGVRVVREAGHAIIEVTDDGRGGADQRGSGLRGLGDRVGALGGRIDCHSPSNGGTVLRAEIPCAS
ncbi:histidine kinase [Solirubrobacter ginsenosidimutans]|uniref:histidine kinase n=1 Tax=Solirubrobacter ginsenosidimutans TaxID=490573 RepID=A0A9X3N188_9ACTN|nr:histidine kinase [Solirubrobacter ginsenosidimutans]MDA0166510.1 histidine kinase [Solirubrobacter ginsenosidimutans]